MTAADAVPDAALPPSRSEHGPRRSALRLCLGSLLAAAALCWAVRAADAQVWDPAAPPALPPPAKSVAVWPLIRPPHPCIPGWSQGSDGVCRRHAELVVVCDPQYDVCNPLPPEILPYGLGPYLRPDY